MLLRRLREPNQHPPAIARVAGYYARVAATHAAQVERFAGREAAAAAQALPTFHSSWQPRPLSKIKDAFICFVAQHRLALVGTVEGMDIDKKRWDVLHLPAIGEDIRAGPGVPPLFAMLNQLKADFCTVRWLTYQSQVHTYKDTSLYMDTLDYALYGVAPSMLSLAQRTVLDILDRFAVCANDYFGLGDKPHTIYFRTFWREHGGTGAWRPAIQAEVLAGNPGLVALSDLASDLCEGGFLAPKYNLRNVSTHRFCVLHDEGDKPSRPSAAIDHYTMSAFLDQTIGSLQIVRSAILYLLDAIAWHEARIRHDGPMVTFAVVPHHYIRGEDETF